MPAIELSIDINQPPWIVAEAFLDPENHVYWTTDLERFEVVSSEPGYVGSVARLHYRQGDRRYVLEDVLEEYIPNEYFRSRVTGGGLIAAVETRLVATNGGTQVRLRWSGRGTTLLTRLILPLMRRRIAREALKEFETFKRLIESRGPHFSTAE